MSSSSVVGVDLGYQNSLIAVAGRGGVDVILNGNSNRLNPYVLLVCDSR
jgi:heat shock 70kDa protein 4